MNKDELLDAIRRDRATLDQLLASIPPARMLEPSLDAGWTPKDVLAHVAGWEKLCVQWITTARRDEFTAGDEFGPQVDALNARLYAENTPRSLDDVRTDFAASHAALLTMLAGLPDDHLASKPAWAPHAELSRIIDANSAEHYREHIDQLTRWLAAEE